MGQIKQPRFFLVNTDEQTKVKSYSAPSLLPPVSQVERATIVWHFSTPPPLMPHPWGRPTIFLSAQEHWTLNILASSITLRSALIGSKADIKFTMEPKKNTINWGFWGHDVSWCRLLWKDKTSTIWLIVSSQSPNNVWWYVMQTCKI